MERLERLDKSGVVEDMICFTLQEWKTGVISFDARFIQSITETGTAVTI